MSSQSLDPVLGTADKQDCGGGGIPLTHCIIILMENNQDEKPRSPEDFIPGTLLPCGSGGNSINIGTFSQKMAVFFRISYFD